MWKLMIFLLMVAGVEAQKSSPEYIAQEIQTFMKNHKLPGIAAAFYYKGVPYFINFGQANEQTKVTEHTIFEIGSITKSFTATLLAYEVVKGTMKLNGQLSDYLPFVAKHPCALSQVTVEQLATHTSSLPRDPAGGWAGATKDTILNSLLIWKPEYTIGTHLLYSNLGFDILGFALEDRSNIKYEPLLSQVVTAPLQMTSTYITVPSSLHWLYAQGHNKQGIPVSHHSTDTLVASGALRSTTSDLMKFLKANLDLSGPADLRQAMLLAQKGRFKAPNMIQALSWQRETRQGVEFMEKNGCIGGFASWMGMIPHKQMGLILLSNMRCADLLA